jgi:hypothetical protein
VNIFANSGFANPFANQGKQRSFQERMLMLVDQREGADETCNETFGSEAGWGSRGAENRNKEIS